MAALAILMGMPGNFSYTGGQEGLTFPLLLISGAVIGFGTIVPGVSSSFLLMAAGLYDPLLTVLNTRDIPRLLPIALGFGVLCFCSPGWSTGCIRKHMALPALPYAGCWWAPFSPLFRL